MPSEQLNSNGLIRNLRAREMMSARLIVIQSQFNRNWKLLWTWKSRTCCARELHLDHTYGPKLHIGGKYARGGNQYNFDYGASLQPRIGNVRCIMDIRSGTIWKLHKLCETNGFTDNDFANLYKSHLRSYLEYRLSIRHACAPYCPHLTNFKTRS